MKATIYRLGSTLSEALNSFKWSRPRHYCCSAYLLGYRQTHWLQLAGLIVLVPGLGCAFYGYLGIFANRFSQVREAREQRRQALKQNDPFDSN